MKVVHKLFFLSLFFAGSGHAAVAIPVTTFNDENGENLESCSLREAIEAVNSKKAYGGCRAGDLYLENIIQLQSGSYVLSLGELTIKRGVTITGAQSIDTTTKDSITSSNKRLLPSSQISGNGHRLFNTVDSAVDIGIRNVILTNGAANKGGVILAGGGVVFNNVIARNNHATAGGVFYLEGNNASISVSNSTLESNTGAAGAVLAMSCSHHLTAAKHTINFVSSSIINNGADNNKSIFENCGDIAFGLATSTIAKNTAQADGGIINFNSNTDLNTTLAITRSTLMENNIAPVLFYSNLRSIAITSSVLAFNNGQGCMQQGTDTTSFNGSTNVFEDVFPTCRKFEDSKSTAKDLDTVTDDSFANEFTPLGNYGGLTQTYLPKISSKYILDQGADLCTQVPDQRNSDTSYLPANTCDIGAVERRVATTVFEKNAVFTNKSTIGRIVRLNVLENDIPGETDNTEDVANARGSFKKDENGQFIIEIMEGQEFCSIDPPQGDEKLPRLKFDTKGKVLEVGNEKICKYRFMDSNDKYSNIAELKLRIDNMPPNAGNDSFSLPVGSSRMQLPLLDNDNDDNDGEYGDLCTAEDTVCNGLYIRIVTPPRSGVIEGEKSGLCPSLKPTDTSTCLGGKLYYRPDNTLAPFDDSFTYVVYDRDKSASEAATVTITSEARIAEEEEAGTIANSGSLGSLSLVALSALAFYRRFRKLPLAKV